VGVDPVHLGVIIVLNLMIGLLTPPVGMSLYMLSSVARIPFAQVVRIMLPWIVPLVIALLIVTYVPQVVLFLPKLIGIYAG
jgi:TRAP-type C4-dicarboxylate transport system permease large subunit